MLVRIVTSHVHFGRKLYQNTEQTKIEKNTESWILETELGRNIKETPTMTTT